jgi:hypothetical protein
MRLYINKIKNKINSKNSYKISIIVSQKKKKGINSLILILEKFLMMIIR